MRCLNYSPFISSLSSFSTELHVVLMNVVPRSTINTNVGTEN